LDIDHVARIEDLRHRLHRAELVGRLLGPLHAIKRNVADLTVAHDGAAWFATGLQADARGLIAHIEHHRQAPRRDVAEAAHVGKLHAPITGNVDLADGAAIARLLVESDQAVNQRLAGHRLDFGIERGANRQATLIETLLVVLLLDRAAHFLS